MGPPPVLLVAVAEPLPRAGATGMNIPHSLVLAFALTAPAFSVNDDCVAATPLSLGVVAFDPDEFGHECVVF